MQRSPRPPDPRTGRPRNPDADRRRIGRPRSRRISGGLALAAAGALALGVLPAQAAPSVPPAGPVTWQADLSRPAGSSAYGVVSDAAGIVLAAGARPLASAGSDRRQGSYVLPPHRLRTAVTRVAAKVDAAATGGAAVSVRVRGHGLDGRWTEWRETGGGTVAALPAPADQVQVGIDLTGGSGDRPRVSRVALTADAAAPGAEPGRGSGDGPEARAVSFRLFATREGLVGGTTANGHVIVERDHFVALPSRRALNPNDSTRDFQVQVCYPVTGRCETAPVWDVGPWNTKDDYWNPSAEREMWQDLPQGTPEAQAAYIDGYNGGLDQFGRRVLNPAGIDLADGTFWDGLGMTDNDYVDVTFLWTG